MSKTEETVIPFETVRVPDGDKPKGFEQTISDGVDGKRTVTYSEDGQILSDRTKHAKNKVVYFGTKEEGEQTDSLSTGKAGDTVVGNSTENVSTPEPPQEETSKDTPEKDETDKDSFIPAETYKTNQTQGRFSQLIHTKLMKLGKDMNGNALFVRAFKTFVQAGLATWAVTNFDFTTGAIVGAIAAGLSALMNLFIQPVEAK